MSHFTNRIGPSGPILICFLSASSPKEAALRDAGLPIPPAQIANILIDTGASHTVIDSRFVGLLGLDQTGVLPTHTPTTGTIPIDLPTYGVSISFAGIANAIHTLPAHSVSASDFSGQGIDGLLGRDVLASARLTYSGPDSTYYLSF